MFSVIPISLIIITLGLLLYIVSRHTTEIEQTGRNSDIGENKRLFDFIGDKFDLEGMKSKGVLVVEKSLHKARKFLLKTDNTLMGLIGKIKNGNDKNIQKPEMGTKTDNFWHNIAVRHDKESEIKTEVASMADIKPSLPFSKLASAEYRSKKRNKKTNLPA